MIKNTADFIVSVLVTGIVFAIIFLLFTLFKGQIVGQFLNGLKNNTGNYSTFKILMWVAIFVAAYFLINWIVSSIQKPSIKRSSSF